LKYTVKKNGKRRKIQTYKCIDCGYKFQNKRKKHNASRNLVQQYIWHRQTYVDLANTYGHSTKWVQRRIDKTNIAPVVKLNPKTELVLIVDATFFSRSVGLTVFREPHLKKNIWWKQTASEKAEVYQLGRQYLEKNGFKIRAVILDGRTGFKAVFKDIPVQMCHFHQKRIINKYLTTRPKLPASLGLREIAKSIPHQELGIRERKFFSYYYHIKGLSG
jgi:hypothetical protein